MEDSLGVPDGLSGVFGASRGAGGSRAPGVVGVVRAPRLVTDYIPDGDLAGKGIIITFLQPIAI